VSGQAIEWAGRIGSTRETSTGEISRTSTRGTVFEGTSNVQLQTISKFIQK
ncbi:hypothetical protein F5141DRAFT_979468, partial [Pisolithus sp. B1]